MWSVTSKVGDLCFHSYVSLTLSDLHLSASNKLIWFVFNEVVEAFPEKLNHGQPNTNAVVIFINATVYNKSDVQLCDVYKAEDLPQCSPPFIVVKEVFSKFKQVNITEIHFTCFSAQKLICLQYSFVWTNS